LLVAGYYNYNARERMKPTLLEKIMIWIAKLAQIIAIVQANPTESHISMARSMTSHDGGAPGG